MFLVFFLGGGFLGFCVFIVSEFVYLGVYGCLRSGEVIVGLFVLLFDGVEFFFLNNNVFSWVLVFWVVILLVFDKENDIK